jgi:ribosomal protein S12 methylthiotransferase
MQKSRIGIISLGCPRNLADSEKILGRLRQQKHRIVDIKDADIAIVNTCSFIKEAKEESISHILNLIELKKQGRLKKIVVYGCLVQRYKEELATHLKEIDAFVGRISFDGDQIIRRFNLTPPHYAYIKISEGCNNLCSYCIIPKIKGRLTSRSPDAILNQVVELDTKRDVSEINIIGQDITLYGRDRTDKEIDLVGLLREIIAHTHRIRWIRLLYTHPAHIDDRLIDFIAKEKRMCKYIDLPLQHINDKILKRMNRHITRRQIIALLDKIRQRIPDVAIRTSLIVGFPGETEREFNELLEFVKDRKFERLGVFMYSREEGTAAYDFKGQVAQKDKKRRFDTIMQAQQLISARINRALLNKRIEVLIDESQIEDGQYLARTQADAPEVDGLVYVKASAKLRPGDFIKVKVIDTYEYDLVAQQL